MASMSLSLK